MIFRFCQESVNPLRHLNAYILANLSLKNEYKKNCGKLLTQFLVCGMIEMIQTPRHCEELLVRKATRQSVDVGVLDCFVVQRLHFSQ